MDLTFENTRPHVTMSIFHCDDDPELLAERAIGSLDGLAGTLKPVPAHPGETENYVTVLEPYRVDGATAYGAWYTVEKAPAWFKSAATEEDLEDEDDTEPVMVASAAEDDALPPVRLLDITNHLVILVAYRRYVAVFASHETMRSRLNDLIEFGEAGEEKQLVKMGTSATPLKREEIERAFVRGNTKNAWLQGLHAPTILKADRKIMSGPDLRYAIDHFDDQTFTYTAAISEVTPAEARTPRQSGKKSGYKVGVSHSKNTIWTTPTKKFDDFIHEMKKLVDMLDGAKPDGDALPEVERAGVPFIAHPMQSPDLALLSDGFDVGYEPSDNSDEEILSGKVKPDEASIDAWRANGRFVVDFDHQAIPKRAYEIVADAYYSDRLLAKLLFRPVARANFAVEILTSVPKYLVDKDDPDMVALDRSLMKRNNALTLRYASGHVIQGGKLYPIGFRDVIFDGWVWKKFAPALDNGVYNVGKEKPTKPNPNPKSRDSKVQEIYAPELIGKLDSLFCYVKNNVLDIIAPQGPPSLDWRLLCDDGAGELADFIAYIPETKSITFIHIKASKDGAANSISVTPFSEVVSQATKNLRFFDRGMMLTGLEERTRENNLELVWRAGAQAISRTEFLAELKAVHEPLHRHVVILQPRISRSTWLRVVADHDARSGSPDVSRMRQLSALLSSELSTFQKLDATFSVIGVDDDDVDADLAATSLPIKATSSSSPRNRRAKASR